ncbi:glycosyltransferase family 4 protein [Scleromatobacter humisilvae]|uniref:Glycosyltransferase family 1 protein n=1 Tax=Scleromatobacter humisilvae TaxID=2897159 RepID=A0A9X1YJ13_9BURK|nr:glycosyltransferase family 1 protein [Scleromatobacter humisilvae]MCK9685297.1 glycosyltransferase family 1 protein [Scleromatobacter humisilvae]
MDIQSGLPRPLRIACVTETYPPEVNGVAMTVARLVQSLRARHHAVQVVRPRQKSEVGASSADGQGDVLVHGVPIPRYAGLRMGLPCMGRLVKLWKKHRPDVVHIATEGPLGRSALLAARRLGLPVCSEFRTNFHAYSQHYGFGFLRGPIIGYLRRFHNATQCTMVPTQALHDDLAKEGFHNLLTVARGVDVRRFDTAHRSEALRAQWGAAPDDLVVTCVGRLAPEKNLATLVSAFEAIRRQQPRARLVLVGDGPMRKELQARCPDAIFAGQRIGDDLAAHYASADLFLFPSVTETFGNVTTEAMASGLAVVAFDYAAAQRVIEDGVSGALVSFNDNAAFVARAARVAADLAHCRVLGTRARTSVMALDWDSIAAQVEGVMASVMRAVEPVQDYAFAPARHSSV